MRRRFVVALVAVAAVTACTKGGSTGTPGSAPTTTTTSAAPSPTPSPSPTFNPLTLLPSDCGIFIAESAVEHAIGRPVFGVRYLREKPLPSGRLGRVTCTWPTRVHSKGARVPAEVSATVNVYADTATVADRLLLTIDADRAAGNRISGLTVAGHSGKLDVDRWRTTLLMPIDQRVIVLQVDHASCPARRAPAALTALARIALRTVPHRRAAPAATP